NLSPKREVEAAQQSQHFFIISGCSGYHDIQSSKTIDFVVINFGEHNLFLDTQAVISATIECPRAQPTKLTYPWQHDVDQPIKKFIHMSTPQGDLAANRPTFTNLEPGTRLSGPRHDRFLARNKLHVRHCRFNGLAIGTRFT